MKLSRYLKCLVNVSIPPSGRIIGCVLIKLLYCSSSRFRLVNSLSCVGLVASGSEVVESGGSAGVGSASGLKYPGSGKKIASIFDALEVVPVCIWRVNLSNWFRMMCEPSSISALDWKAKAPSST